MLGDGVCGDRFEKVESRLGEYSRGCATRVGSNWKKLGKIGKKLHAGATLATNHGIKIDARLHVVSVALTG